MIKHASTSTLKEVTREEIWALLSPNDREDITSLLTTFWSAEDRRTLPLTIRVGDCVYSRPDLRTRAAHGGETPAPALDAEGAVSVQIGGQLYEQAPPREHAP